MQTKLYVEGSSFLHRLHPSTKLVWYFIFYFLMSLLPWQVKLVTVGTMIVVLWFCGITPKNYRTFLVLTLPTLVLYPLFRGIVSERGDPIIYQISRIAIHQNGLIVGLTFSSLYLALGISTVAWMTTTRLWEFPEAFTSLGFPHMVGFVIGNVLRLMPEFINHRTDLIDVQKSRGVDFDHGPIWTRFWKQCLLMANLLLLELAQLRTRNSAIEARGFSTKQKPTVYILPEIPKREKASMIVGFLLVLVSILARLTRIL